MEAALKGAEQIGFTIVSLTVSLIAVLIPLLFMGDVVGRLFREFAVTLAVTIIISAVVSLTLTPMMSARILRHEPKEQQGRILPSVGARLRAHDRVLRAHLEGRAGIPDHHASCGARHAGAHGLSLHHDPQGIFPGAGYGSDSGHFAGSRNDFVCRRWRRSSRNWPRSFSQDPAVQSLSSFIGADGTNTTLNSGRMSINLKPLADRSHISASDVIRRLQSKLQNVQGISLYMQPVQNITVDDRVSRTQYQYTLEDPDANELNEWTQPLCRETEKLAAAGGRGDRPADGRAGGFADHRSRRPRRGWASLLRRSTTRFMTLSGSGRSTRCTRSSTSIT